MKIVPYHPKYKDAFIEMNKQWISEMFVPVDKTKFPFDRADIAFERFI